MPALVMSADIDMARAPAGIVAARATKKAISKCMSRRNTVKSYCQRALDSSGHESDENAKATTTKSPPLKPRSLLARDARR